MSVDVTIRVFGDEKFARELLRVGDRGSDMSPVLRHIAVKWIEWNAEQFASEGRRASGGWAPLAEATVRKRGTAHPILEEKGELVGAATDITNINIEEDGLTLELPEDVDTIGGFHDTGTTRMPQRRPVEFTERDKRNVTSMLQRYLIEGRV